VTDEQKSRIQAGEPAGGVYLSLGIAALIALLHRKPK
jgi:hypothetical protein